MRKGYVWILAIVALLGMVNGVFAESAFACDEDAANCALPLCHNCLVAHAVSHQWIVPETFQLFSLSGLSSVVNVPFAKIPVDPPLGSIFHPPTPF